MAKVVVELPSSSLVVDVERVTALVEAILTAEKYGSRYKSNGYLTTIEPFIEGITITPLSDEHYKMYKIAGEQE